jgi:hypothetical protein
MKENKIQSECVMWYRNTYCKLIDNPRGLIFSVPNELAGDSKIATMQAKAMGLMSGVSDTILILPNSQLIFCEFKDAKGKQSEVQVRFEIQVKEHGFDYWLVRSIEGFKEKVYETLTR